MNKQNKIIKSLWIGNKLSNLEKLSIKSFIVNGHEYHLYAYNKISGIPDCVKIKDANKIIPEKDIFLGERCDYTFGGIDAFSDYFRHKLLYKLGGWWVDTDVICLQPFDFEDEYVFSSQSNPTRLPEATSGIIKVPAGCDEMKYCWDYCKSIKNISDIKYRQIGPDLIMKIIEKFNKREYLKAWETFMPIGWWEINKLVMPNVNFEIKKNMYSIHFWNERWRRQGYDKNSIYDKYSVFEQLKNYYNV